MWVFFNFYFHFNWVFLNCLKIVIFGWSTKGYVLKTKKAFIKIHAFLKLTYTNSFFTSTYTLTYKHQPYWSVCTLTKLSHTLFFFKPPGFWTSCFLLYNIVNTSTFDKLLFSVILAIVSYRKSCLAWVRFPSICLHISLR